MVGILPGTSSLPVWNIDQYISLLPWLWAVRQTLHSLESLCIRASAQWTKVKINGGTVGSADPPLLHYICRSPATLFLIIINFYTLSCLVLYSFYWQCSYYFCTLIISSCKHSCLSALSWFLYLIKKKTMILFIWVSHRTTRSVICRKEISKQVIYENKSKTGSSSTCISFVLFCQLEEKSINLSNKWD